MFLFCFVCYVTKIDVDVTDKTDNNLSVMDSSQTSYCHLKYFKVNKLFENSSITFLFVMISAPNCRNLSWPHSSLCCKILSNIYSWADCLLGLSNVLSLKPVFWRLLKNSCGSDSHLLSNFFLLKSSFATDYTFVQAVCKSSYVHRKFP